jgi:hypothetical protein
MIKKQGKNWVVTDSSGKKILGTHLSKDRALKQLAAVEISKKKKREKVMQNEDHYYIMRCAELNEIKKQLIAKIKSLNEQLVSQAMAQTQMPQGQQGSSGQKKQTSPKEQIESPVKMHMGFQHAGGAAGAQEELLKNYSDDPKTEEEEVAKDASWQSVNSAIGNYMSQQISKLAKSQQMVKEESESNKRELARINADRKAEGKPPFRTLDAALSYYEKEDERARKKKLQG